VSPPDVVALFGPTGVGKTAVAVALAERLRGAGEDPVAVSADALAVYRGLEVLTGAPTDAERSRLEHRLVSFLDVAEPFSAGAYARLAHNEIDALLEQSRRPIVVGGTGLYLRAALTDLDMRPPAAPAARARRDAELAAQGPAAMHEQLARLDPEAAARIDPNDGRRVVRALELLDGGQSPPGGEDSQLWAADVRRPSRLFGLIMDRDRLRERIEARVDAMVAAGAEDEVRRADAAGASHTARQALGFDSLLEGDVEAMKARTRRFAKRQLTWMRRLAGVEVLDVTGRAPDDVAAEIAAKLAGAPS
jgi:tRNA dimethylallyltransferase